MTPDLQKVTTGKERESSAGTTNGMHKKRGQNIKYTSAGAYGRNIYRTLDF